MTGNQLISNYQTIWEKYQNIERKMDNLPQMILSKAFKGELESDGDARELLDEIKKLKDNKK